jgi:hypothetical protein
MVDPTGAIVSVCDQRKTGEKNKIKGKVMLQAFIEDKDEKILQNVVTRPQIILKKSTLYNFYIMHKSKIKLHITVIIAILFAVNLSPVW